MAMAIGVGWNIRRVVSARLTGFGDDLGDSLARFMADSLRLTEPPAGR